MANTENTNEQVRVWLDLPAQVNEMLVAEAMKNRRSRTQHIVFILEQHCEESRKTEAQEASA